MQNSLDYAHLLRLIDERSTAFRAAVAAAPSLDAKVPTCPEWTLRDLVQHIGEGRRVWAATIAAGPGATAKAVPTGDTTAPEEREAALAWLAESTRLMVDALREAGPDRGCWTWWGKSQTPQTCAGVARRQLQEIAVHTYDAQLTVGDPQPLPTEVAVDGVEDFLSTMCTTTEAWPHRAAVVEYRVTEGRTWRNLLSAEGATAVRVPDAEELPAADASARGTANDLVLAFFDRIPLDVLQLDGDLRLFEQLQEWDPER